MSVLAQIKQLAANPLEAPVDVTQQRFLQMHWMEFIDIPTGNHENEEEIETIETTSSVQLWRPGPPEENEPME